MIKLTSTNGSSASAWTLDEDDVFDSVGGVGVDDFGGVGCWGDDRFGGVADERALGLVSQIGSDEFGGVGCWDGDLFGGAVDRVESGLVGDAGLEEMDGVGCSVVGRIGELWRDEDCTGGMVCGGVGDSV